MRPLDFITLARLLGKNQNEASLRSAASRAYYGAFHFAGEQLERLTAGSLNRFQWSGRRKSHGDLRAEWRSRHGQTGRIIATALFNAQQLRNKADYDLHLVFTPRDKEAAFRFVARVLLEARRMR